MAPEVREPELSRAQRRIVAALLLSIGAHAAVVGLLRLRAIAPSAVESEVLQIRLTAKPAAARTASVTPTPTAPAPAPDEPPQQSTPVPPDKSGRLAVDVPLLVDETYYPTRELDVLPRPLSPVHPLYPVFPPQHEVQGWVLLRLKIDDTGLVRSAEVSAADPPGVFDQSALAAFGQARFAPAQKDGRAVNSLVQIKVSFRIK